MCLFSHFPFALSERKIEGHLYPERCSGLYACWAFSPSLLHANPLYSIVMIDTSYDWRLFHRRVVLLKQKQMVVFCQQTTLLKKELCTSIQIQHWMDGIITGSDARAARHNFDLCVAYEKLFCRQYRYPAMAYLGHSHDSCYLLFTFL